jgi:hypothetical protein
MMCMLRSPKMLISAEGTWNMVHTSCRMFCSSVTRGATSRMSPMLDTRSLVVVAWP